MTQNENERIRAVEDLLADARRRETAVPSGLTHRVTQDAAAIQPNARQVAARRKGLRAFKWPRLPVVGAFGGMVTASCVGFWFGVNPPSAFEGIEVLNVDPWAVVYTDDAAEVSGFGWDLGEI